MTPRLARLATSLVTAQSGSCSRPGTRLAPWWFSRATRRAGALFCSRATWGYNAASWDELRLPGPLVDADEMHRGLAWVRDMRARKDCVAALAAHDPNPALQGGATLSF